LKKLIKLNDVMYFVRGTVSAEVAKASGGTEELKTRYKGVRYRSQERKRLLLL
tara:strand:+ start:910 stop:1068 length:159 start_codon:yes stop_codon:yes gene_type:complete